MIGEAGRLANGFGSPVPFGHRNGFSVGSARINELDRVDAVAAAALCRIDHVVEDRQAAEVGVLSAAMQIMTAERTPLVSQSPSTPTPVGSFNITQLGDKAVKIAQDDPGRLRVAAIASIAGGVQQAGIVLGVQTAARPLFPLYPLFAVKWKRPR
jgi:hypothetical protein